MTGEEFTGVEVFANEYLYYPSEPNAIIRFVHNNKIYVVGYDIEEAPSVSRLRDERGYCKPPSDLVSRLKKFMKEQREVWLNGGFSPIPPK